MTIVSAPAAAEAPLLGFACPKAEVSHRIADAARILLPHLERGQRVDAVTLRAAMERTFGGSDAAGAWDWKKVAKWSWQQHSPSIGEPVGFHRRHCKQP
jgi:hypothetical protein